MGLGAMPFPRTPGLLEVWVVNHSSALTLHCLGQETEAQRYLVTHATGWIKKVVMKLVALYLNFQYYFKTSFCFYYERKVPTQGQQTMAWFCAAA